MFARNTQVIRQAKVTFGAAEPLSLARRFRSVCRRYKNITDDHLGAMEVAHEASRYLLDNNSCRPGAECLFAGEWLPGEQPTTYLLLINS